MDDYLWMNGDSNLSHSVRASKQGRQSSLDDDIETTTTAARAERKPTSARKRSSGGRNKTWAVNTLSLINLVCNCGAVARRLTATHTPIVSVEELFLARVPKSSAEVRRVFIQEQQGDKREDEEGDEVMGEVEEVRSNDNKEETTKNEGSTMHEDSCIGINYAHRFPKCFRSLHTLLGFSLCTSCRQFNYCGCTNLCNFDLYANSF